VTGYPFQYHTIPLMMPDGLLLSHPQKK